MADVSVTFNADTGQYVANVQGMEKATASAAEAVAKAKNMILASNKSQIESAQELGKTTDELARIQKKSAESMANVTDANANNIIASLNRISEKNKLVAAELANLPKIAQTGVHNISDRQAASGFVRLGEGNDSLRAVETFITTIPYAGRAMQALFPIIGAAGLAGLIFDFGEKAYEAFEKATHAAEESRRAFGALNEKLETSNDELALSNSRMEDEIARLSGHPTNGLATALLEAKVAADKLQDSLAGNVRELQSLLKEHSVSFFESEISGVGGTSGVEKDLTQRSNKLQDDNQAAEDAMDAKLDAAKQQHERDVATAGKNKAALASADAKLKQATTDANNTYFKTLQTNDDNFSAYSNGKVAELAPKAALNLQLINGLDGLGTAGKAIRWGLHTKDITQDVDDYRAAATFGKRQSRQASESKEAFDGDATLGQVKQSKEGLGDANKAAEQRMKAFEAELAQMKLNTNVSAKAEFDYWAARRNAFKIGSEQYNEIVEKQSTLAIEGAHKATEAIAKYKKDSSELANLSPEQAQRGIREMNSLFQEQEQDVTRTGASWRTYNEEVAKGAEIQRKAAAAMREAQIQHAVATGALSRPAADRQISALHNDDASAQIEALQNQQRQPAADYANVAPWSKDGGKQLADQYESLQNQVSKVRGDADLAYMQDQWKEFSDTAVGGAITALQEFRDATMDNAATLKALTNDALRDVNKPLIDVLTGQYKQGEGKNSAKDFAVGVTGSLVKKGEGELLGKLGLGKADGSAMSPFWVKLAGGKLGAPDLPKDLPALAGPLASFGKSLFSGYKAPNVVLAGGGSGGSGDKDGTGGSSGSLADLGESLFSGYKPPSVGDGGDDDDDDDSDSGDSDASLPASSGDKAAGGFFGLLSKIIPMFGGHKALGGGVDAGVAYDVGEMGRETFVPSTPGTIIPHSQLGGNGATYTVNVANGVTPEQMNMHVQAALREFHPQVVRSSVAAVHEERRRNTSTHS